MLGIGSHGGLRVKEEMNGLMRLIPDDATLEQKRKKRHTHEEGRRKKQLQARDIDDQLKKLQDYQDSLLSDELKCGGNAGPVGMFTDAFPSVLPNFDTFVSSLGGSTD